MSDTERSASKAERKPEVADVAILLTVRGGRVRVRIDAPDALLAQKLIPLSIQVEKMVTRALRAARRPRAVEIGAAPATVEV